MPEIFQHGGKKLAQLRDNTIQQPKISIITVVFNSVVDLESTIKSVLELSYENYEYIVIDGGSTDGTIEIIKKYDSKIDYWISQPDHGIYDAMNKGIELARGEIIGILNSGDLYVSDALEEVVRLTQQYQEQKYLVITGAMYRFDQQTATKFKQIRTVSDLQRNINIGMPINHPATFVTKKTYQKFGVFNPEYKICGDHDLFFRLYHTELVDFIFTERALASMSMGGVSETFASLWIRVQEKIAIRRYKINIFHNIFLSLKLLLIGYIKHFLVAIFGQKAVYINHKIIQKMRNNL